MSKLAGIAGVVIGTLITIGGFNLCIYGADANWTAALIGGGVAGLLVGVFLACVNWRGDPVKESFAAMLAMAGLYLVFAVVAAAAGYQKLPHPIVLFQRCVALLFCGAVAGQFGIVIRQLAAFYLERLAPTPQSALRLLRFALAYTTGGAIIFGGIVLSNRIVGTANDVLHCVAAGLIAVGVVMYVHFNRFKAKTTGGFVVAGLCLLVLLVAVMYHLVRHADGTIIDAWTALAGLAAAAAGGIIGRAVLELLTPKTG